MNNYVVIINNNNTIKMPTGRLVSSIRTRMQHIFDGRPTNCSAKNHLSHMRYVPISNKYHNQPK